MNFCQLKIDLTSNNTSIVEIQKSWNKERRSILLAFKRTHKQQHTYPGRPMGGCIVCQQFYHNLYDIDTSISNLQTNSNFDQLEKEYTLIQSHLFLCQIGQ